MKELLLKAATELRAATLQYAALQTSRPMNHAETQECIFLCIRVARLACQLGDELSIRLPLTK